MRPGVTVRTVWYRDGREWRVREEAWAFHRYGESGIVSDVSVADQQRGLQPETYEVGL